MYRIDEDTYIDDSLVTCAEYQLFIDEMRAQGKFYQPDHWTSYQFPAGQAHTPILGVRPSDAETFCKWLSIREGGQWRYRLPTINEASKYPISKQNETVCGFWNVINNVSPGYSKKKSDVTPRSGLQRRGGLFTDEKIASLPREGLITMTNQTYPELMSNKQKYSFAWIGTPSINPRRIDFSYVFTSGLADDRTQILKRTHIIDRNYISNSGFIMNRIIDFLFIFNIASALDVAQVLKLAHTSDQPSALNLDHIFDRTIIFNIIPTTDLARESAITLDLARSNHRARLIAFNLIRQLANTIGHDIDMTPHQVLTIWIDLFTLQERIEGRSPAFEGIRFIRERMK